MVDSQGNVYVVVGNGTYDGVTEFGESFLKLSPQLKLLDWYTPENWQSLSISDYDLGTTGAAYLCSLNLVLTGNKYGTDLRGQSGFDGPPVYRNGFSAESAGRALGWSVHVRAISRQYRADHLCAGAGLGSAGISNDERDFSDHAPFAETTTTFNMPQPYDGIAISSNGGDPTTAIVWMTRATTASRPTPASLHAFDATTLQELWNTDMVPSRDYLGLFAKFAMPTIVNGKVFVPTFSSELAVYGLLPAAANAVAPTPQIAAVVNAASYASEPFLPVNSLPSSAQQMGPNTLSQWRVRQLQSAVPLSIRGSRHFSTMFRLRWCMSRISKSAPSCPIGVTGPTVQVSLLAGSEWSNQLTVDLAKSTPAIFSLDSSGMGQIVAANQDGTLNATTAPAAKGSVITLYATGAGAMTPVPVDGSVTAGTLALPVLPVTAQIDGQDAQVQYAGAAPGIVAGVIQVNLYVPAGARSGSADSIVLNIGGPDQSERRYYRRAIGTIGKSRGGR